MLFGKRPASEAEKHYLEALRFRDRKNRQFDFGQSLWHFRQAIALEPNNPVFHCHLAKAYVAAPLLGVTRGIGSSLDLKRSADMAVAEAREALQLQPDYAEACLILGEAYMYLGEKDKALQFFDAVMDISSRGYLAAHAERERRQVERGISLNPNPAQALRHIQQAVMNMRNRKYRSAERELNKAIRLAPDWSWLYHSVCEFGT